MMMAAFLKTPELAIDQSEANALAQAVKRVSRHYDTSVSAKTLDHIALGQAVLMVYGPRAVAIFGRSRKPANRGEANGGAPQHGAHDPNQTIIPFLNHAG